MEKQIDIKLPLIDVLIVQQKHLIFRLEGIIKRQSLVTNYQKFTPHYYKIGLAKNLLDRAFMISSSYCKFYKDCDSTKNTLPKSCFPLEKK